MLNKTPTGNICPRCGHEHEVNELEDSECFVCGAHIDFASDKLRKFMEVQP